MGFCLKSCMVSQDPSNSDTWVPCPGHPPVIWQTPEGPLSANSVPSASQRRLHSGRDSIQHSTSVLHTTRCCVGFPHLRSASWVSSSSQQPLAEASVSLLGQNMQINVLRSRYTSYSFTSLTRPRISPSLKINLGVQGLTTRQPFLPMDSQVHPIASLPQAFPFCTCGVNRASVHTTCQMSLEVSPAFHLKLFPVS